MRTRVSEYVVMKAVEFEPQIRKLARLRERVIRQMLDPEHATKAEKIQAALAASGSRRP
jgi:hypothetical protein